MRKGRGPPAALQLGELRAPALSTPTPLFFPSSPHSTPAGLRGTEGVPAYAQHSYHVAWATSASPCHGGPSSLPCLLTEQPEWPVVSEGGRTLESSAGLADLSPCTPHSPSLPTRCAQCTGHHAPAPGLPAGCCAGPASSASPGGSAPPFPARTARDAGPLTARLEGQGTQVAGTLRGHPRDPAVKLLPPAHS